MLSNSRQKLKNDFLIISVNKFNVRKKCWNIIIFVVIDFLNIDNGFKYQILKMLESMFDMIAHNK